MSHETTNRLLEVAQGLKQPTANELEELEILRNLIKNPENRAKFVDAMVGIKTSHDKPRKSPSEWASRPPYYREKFAIEVKVLLDTMVKDNLDMLIPWKSARLSRASLYIKVTQAMSYLCDNMDTPDGFYNSLRAKVRITREQSGMRLSLSRTRLNSYLPSVRKAAKAGELVQWRDSAISFIENGAVGDALHLQHLVLLPEDVAMLQGMLEGNDSFKFKVTESEILIARVQ